MTGYGVLRRLRALGCWPVLQRGSHVIVRCSGGCQTVILVHTGRDVPAGTLRAIERALEPFLGGSWMT
ncbi:MAG: type II toxin-antitoxin system HicA family toxin [Ilumatobacteraceae bacterium]